MAKNKRQYTSPEGIRYAASGAFSNASMAWILNFIWQFLLVILNIGGVAALLLNVVGYAMLIYAALKTFTAFESEIQADAMLHKKVDRSLSVMKRLVIVAIIGRTLLTATAIFCNIAFSLIRQSPAYRQIDAIINILAGLFTTINILGVFTYKIFIQDGGYKKIKLFSLVALIAIVVHFLTFEIKYILILNNPNIKVSALSDLVSVSAIVSYFAMYLMFEARKELYKTREKQRATENAAS